jgi:hypothetical protein
MECDLLIISLATGSVVRGLELYQPVDAVTKALGREPDFASNGLFSWADVELRQLERLLLQSTEPDPEGFEEAKLWRTQFRGEDYFWTIYCKASDV